MGDWEGFGGRNEEKGLLLLKGMLLIFEAREFLVRKAKLCKSCLSREFCEIPEK